MLLVPVGLAGQRERPADPGASRSREEAARERWQRVAEVFSLAGVRPGARVADIGAGGGFLTVRLARAVGPAGRVYAVDIVPRALQALRDRVREEGLGNVEVVEGTVDDPRLPSGALDAAVMLYAYHEMTANEAMLRHVREALKPDGRLVLVEPTSRLVAPDRPAQREADVLSAELAERDLRAAGFHVAELRDPFATDLGGRSLQWLIVAHRAPGVLLVPLSAARRTYVGGDGRAVIAPPGRNDDITRADLRVSVDVARARAGSGRVTFVDLRSDAEYVAGHVRGAVSMLSWEMDARMKEVAARGGAVFIYCR